MHFGHLLIYIKLVKVVEQTTCYDNDIALYTIMYCAFVIDKMDRVSMHSNGRNKKKVFLYARDIENIIQDDYISIEGCNMNLTKCLL